jgi:hypothetical protein
MLQNFFEKPLPWLEPSQRYAVLVFIVSVVAFSVSFSRALPYFVVFAVILGVVWVLVRACTERINALRTREEDACFKHDNMWPAGRVCSSEQTASRFGVRWQVSILDRGEIWVDLPPRCPKCDGSLLQAPRCFRGFTWKCVSQKCPFTIRSPQPFSEALKVVWREMADQRRKGAT